MKDCIISIRVKYCLKQGIEITPKTEFTNLVTQQIYSQTVESANYNTATTVKTKHIGNSEATQYINMPLSFNPLKKESKPVENLSVVNTSNVQYEKSDLFDLNSCIHCEEIYKFSIFNDIPLKAMICSFCNNELNTNSLDFYITKYKEEVLKLKAERLSRDVTIDKISKLGNQADLEKDSYNFKYGDESEIDASSEIIYNDVSQPQIGTFVTEIIDTSAVNSINNKEFDIFANKDKEEVTKDDQLNRELDTKTEKKTAVHSRVKSNTSSGAFNRPVKRALTSINNSGKNFNSNNKASTGSFKGSVLKKSGTTVNSTPADPKTLKTRISLLKPIDKVSHFSNAKVQ